MGLSEPGRTVGEVSLERMVRAVEKVRNRLLRAARALEQAKVPYAVVGGNAVAAWVARHRLRDRRSFLGARSQPQMGGID
jgi:hypothetical protein